MKTLSIQQPWAALIATGAKDIENRTRAVRYRGALAIHASLTVDYDANIPTAEGGLALHEAGGWHKFWQPRMAGQEGPALLACGAVIAVAELVDCHESHAAGPGRHDQALCYDRSAGVCSPWAVPGMAHWQLADVRPLPEPVVCRGSLGLWTLPDEVEAAVMGQLAEAGR